MDNIMREVFTKEHPLGPLVSPDTTNCEVLNRVFYRENLIYREMASRPSLIIGRRGSGKTAFLRSAYLDDSYSIIVELPAHDTFRQIVNSVERIGGRTVFVEEVAELWDLLFWHAILVALTRYHKGVPALDPVRRYLVSAGLERIRSPYPTIQSVINILKQYGDHGPAEAVDGFLDQVASEGYSYPDARNTATEYLARNHETAIILLDSLEDYKLDDEVHGHAIQGLLKCIGSFRTPGSHTELRCSVPSEIYFRLRNLSSNPNRDFQDSLLIQWDASELIRLAGHRYLTYLELYHPQIHERFQHLDMTKRAQAQQLWDVILPPRITNGVGSNEMSLAYILRHTQLRPRHLLTLLSHICLKNESEGSTPDHITDSALWNGMYEVEDLVCSDILSAYLHTYPDARAACERCIPFLPLRFTDGDMHTVYNQRGRGLQGVYDYDDFRRMMIEIGAVGRVVRETDRYVIGRFEYSVPHRLLTGANDELCLHPVFCEVFSAIKPSAGEHTRVIYPYGSDIGDDDRRQLR